MSEGHFTRKIIETRIKLASETATHVLKGLPAMATVEKVGMPARNKATVTVYGMRYEDMDRLTFLASAAGEVKNNTLVLMAGTEEEELSRVFAGEITQAVADFGKAPDVAVTFQAEAGYYAAHMVSKALTCASSVPVETVVSGLAAECGYGFRNEGVTARLRRSVLMGSVLDKMKKAAEEAGVALLVDDGTVTILPRGGAMSAADAVSVSAAEGLIGYPSFAGDEMLAGTRYNPALRFNGLIRVESVVPRASGLWRITKLTHRLGDALFADKSGPWRSDIRAVRYEG